MLGEYWGGGELAHMVVLTLFFCSYSVMLLSETGHQGDGPFVIGPLRQCSSLKLCLRGFGDDNQYLHFMSSPVPDLPRENSWTKHLTKLI